MFLMIYFYAFTILLFVIDLVTKRWIAAILNVNEEINIVADWLSWKLIHNQGVSFGILSEYVHLVIFISAAITFFVFYLFWKTKVKSISVQIAFALMISGAIGNLFDRITLGYVIDFIDFRGWPAIFNVADLAIRTGAVYLFVLFIWKRWTLK